MSPLDADVVRRKLAVIARNLRDLAAIADLSLDDYQSDRLRLSPRRR